MSYSLNFNLYQIVTFKLQFNGPFAMYIFSIFGSKLRCVRFILNAEMQLKKADSYIVAIFYNICITFSSGRFSQHMFQTCLF